MLRTGDVPTHMGLADLEIGVLVDGIVEALGWLNL